MSLRVLLADESASIRKVFQLGLQDYGADVKSVHNGLDVIEVAEKYKPHIVFADILLQKKSGYEVSQEMGQNSALKDVPVILMWSSFMELDQKRYQASGAKGELEKPFEVDSMRKLIQNLVELTKSQKISEFLEFPENIKNAFVEDKKPHQPIDTDKELTGSTTIDTEDYAVEGDEEFFIDDEETMAASDITSVTNSIDLYTDTENSSIFNVQSEDAEFDMDELEKVTAPARTTNEVLEISDNDEWTARPLVDHSYQPQAQDEPSPETDQFQSMNLQSDEKLNLDDFLYKPDEGFAPPPTPAPPKTDDQLVQSAPAPQAPQTNELSNEEIEHIVRQETRQYLKSMLSKQIPDLLEKIVREELKLILSEEIALKTTNKNP